MGVHEAPVAVTLCSVDIHLLSCPLIVLFFPLFVCVLLEPELVTLHGPFVINTVMLP